MRESERASERERDHAWRGRAMAPICAHNNSTNHTPIPQYGSPALSPPAPPHTCIPQYGSPGHSPSDLKRKKILPSRPPPLWNIDPHELSLARSRARACSLTSLFLFLFLFLFLSSSFSLSQTASDKAGGKLVRVRVRVCLHALARYLPHICTHTHTHTHTA